MQDVYGLSSDKALDMVSGSELVMGYIVCRTLNEVGKVFWPHEDHVDEVQTKVSLSQTRLSCRTDLGLGSHHSRTLLVEGIGVLTLRGPILTR